MLSTNLPTSLVTEALPLTCTLKCRRRRGRLNYDTINRRGWSLLPRIHHAVQPSVSALVVSRHRYRVKAMTVSTSGRLALVKDLRLRLVIAARHTIQSSVNCHYRSHRRPPARDELE